MTILPRPKSAQPSNDADDGDESTLVEIVRALQSQVTAQQAMIASQSAQNAALTELVKQVVGTVGARATVEAVQVIAPPSAAVDTFTFADLWARYADTLRDKTWFLNAESLFMRVLVHFAPSSWTPASPGARRRRVLRRPAGPDILAASLRPFHWTDFRDALKRGDTPLTATTRNHMLKRLKAMYNFAIDDGRMPTNPIARVKIEPRRPKRETTISDEEIERLKNPTVRAYILTLVSSGMRPAECRTLKWRDVDLATGRIVLSWTGTKGRKTRTVFVPPRAIESWQTLPRYPGNDYIFASPRSRNAPYSESRMWQMWRTDADAAGLRAAPGDGTVHGHDARRSYASRLTKLNVSISKIQALLGHATVQTTEGYISVPEGDLREAHDQLEFANRKSPQATSPKPDNKT